MQYMAAADCIAGNHGYHGFRQRADHLLQIKHIEPRHGIITDITAVTAYTLITAAADAGDSMVYRISIANDSDTLYGNNAAAALISRGLVEMRRFGKSYGAKDDTFLGLSGAGDLFLTASSVLSRNYRVGLGLAEGKTKEAIVEALGEVAEGIGTAYALHGIAQRQNLYLPIATEVYAILEGKDPRRSLHDLLTR